MIDRITVDKILDAANIVDVVSDFVSLKRAGANLKGLCPFHDDRTPSFMVSPSRNYCKCFACGEGGSPVNFIMKHEQLSYPDALRYLAKKYGIKIEEKEVTPEEMQARGDRESMFILNEWARDWFRNELNNTPDGRAIGLAYFRGRGFRDDILERFQVGYCPNSREHTLSADALKAGYQERYLINNASTETDPRQSIGTGLSLKKDNGQLRDRFWGRVMWPIFTVSGRVAGFGGRVLDAATKGVAVKYQNSPESIIYSKRKELFGLFQAREAIRKQDLCYLVEGYTDVMAMHQQGVENVVASSGTALTTDQIRLIHRMTNNITVIFDGDDAGIHASERGIDMLLAEGMSVKLLLLPDGDDPDSFARKHTATEFQDYLKSHQVDFITYKASHLQEGAENNPDAEGKLIHNVAESIAVIPDEITRAVYIRHAAAQMRMEERLIQNAVSAQMAKLSAERQKEAERAQRQQSVQQQQTPAEENSEPQQGFSSQPAADAQQPAASLKVTASEAIELTIVQMIIRHGEQVMFYIENEEGENVPLSVAEYISLSLQDDGLKLSRNIYEQILDEAVAHAHSEGFLAEQYFANHPEEPIRDLAFRLSIDKVELSKVYDGMQTNVRLDEVIPNLMANFKLGIIRNDLKRIIEQMKSPSIKNDRETYKALMIEFNTKNKMAQELARDCGDRVVIR